MYSCKLTPLLRDTSIKLIIYPEGCSPLEFNYIKTCGADFRPHPGIVVDIVEGNNIQAKKMIVRDGIVLFNKGSKNRAVDKLLRNFEVDNDDIKLTMYSKITPELEKIFKMEAGGNPRLMNKLKHKALHHLLQAPVLSYDESVIQVGASGTFSPTISEISPVSSKTLELKLRCMAK